MFVLYKTEQVDVGCGLKFAERKGKSRMTVKESVGRDFVVKTPHTEGEGYFSS